ncbi:MAG: bifunctional glutamate N-acetyltransferase/amino-acid acetyltransferase ArgJ [Thiotrichales bacterium]|nr:bifunctional glutamate N-acetyltransferase/amino-acid acetyltransferase ArgJ [Thiotrichales bacterium]
MSVGLAEPQELLTVDGIRLATASAGLYESGRDDVLLIEFPEDSAVTAVFTRNRFAAAPVTVAREHLAAAASRYCLVNAGNANAGTGNPGIDDARHLCNELAARAGCKADQVLPFSTGVIGERLPVAGIKPVIADCLAGLDAGAWLQGARAIMTTDTRAKGVSRQLTVAGETITVTGIAKGAGMIRPDMATMLAFIGTDTGIDQALLDRLLREAVDASFNRITVDGDTSTNDACLLIATGKSPVSIRHADDESFGKFRDILVELCCQLAQSIVRDGEGATKFVTIRVEQAQSQTECLQLAYTVAHSPLVKTALFASDPNWGRILAAVGRSGLDTLDINAVEIYLNSLCIVRDGGVSREYTEEKGQAAMQEDEITIRIVLNRGTVADQIWTTDLSHDYVRINAEYRT